MTYEQFRLQKDVITIQQVISQEQLDTWMGNDPIVTTRELQGLLRGMALQLSSYIIKQEPQVVKLSEVEVAIELHYPNTFWDWCLKKWSPMWLQHRAKWAVPKLVKVLRKKIATATTDVTIIYPKLKLAFDKELIVPRCGPINWKYEEQQDG